MKKQYICPESLAVRLNTKNMLTTSGFENMGEDIVNGGLSDTQVSGTGSVWSKENKSLWDDEW